MSRGVPEAIFQIPACYSSNIVRERGTAEDSVSAAPRLLILGPWVRLPPGSPWLPSGSGRRAERGGGASHALPPKSPPDAADLPVRRTPRGGPAGARACRVRPRRLAANNRPRRPPGSQQSASCGHSGDPACRSSPKIVSMMRAR